MKKCKKGYHSLQPLSLNGRGGFIVACLVLSLLPVSAMALRADRTKPVDISANSANLNNTTGVCVYTGNVTVDQGTTHLRAEQLTTYSNANRQIYKAVAVGKLARYWTLPDGHKHNLHANADTITYYPIKGIVILVGQAEITQGQDSFKGAHIVYNVNQQEIVSQPIGHSRTEIVLHPKSSHNAALNAPTTPVTTTENLPTPPQS